MSCVAYVAAAIVALNPTWDEDKAGRFAGPICSESEKHDIDPLVVVSIIHHESNWNPRAKGYNRNGSVDYGLLQFNCDTPEKINMGWRKWWCARPNNLRTIRGGLRAGVRLLALKRDTCQKYHKEDTHIEAPLDEDCQGCFKIRRKNHISHLMPREELLKDVLGNHWWVQHFNWYSRGYAKKILYTYLVLRLRMKSNYELLRNRRYKIYAKDKCLTKDDLCLSEYQHRFGEDS